MEQSDFGKDWQCWYENYIDNGLTYFRIKTNITNNTRESLAWGLSGYKYIRCHPNFSTNQKIAVVKYYK